MAIVKVLEIIAESDKSWDDAGQNAVTEAGKTVRGIRHIYVENMSGIVEDGKIVKYRINAKVSFVVD